MTGTLAAVSCDQLKHFADGEILASVGDKRLYVSDVAGIFSQGMTPQDSIVLLESYVNLWVRQQLKIIEAERIFSESSSDIDRMVLDYRNSLLSHRLDQFYIDNRIDTVISESEVAAYYNDRRSDFILDRPIVKGRTAKLPADYRQKSMLKELMSKEGDKYQDFHDMAIKNGFEVREYAAWTDMSDFMADLPLKRKAADPGTILSSKGVVEISDGDDLYLVYISESRGEGDIAPLDRVNGVIRQIINHQRRLDILRGYEDSLYSAAMKENLVDIKTN